jgi:hypothetical protein
VDVAQEEEVTNKIMVDLLLSRIPSFLMRLGALSVTTYKKQVNFDIVFIITVERILFFYPKIFLP